MILASGRGRTFQALLDHSRRRREWEVTGLLVDRPSAPVVALARESGCPVHVVDPTDPDPVLRQLGPDLVLLAGYLRLVPASVTRAWAGRMLNVHPSLLPAFGGAGMYGMRVHQAVLAAGVRITGATVHQVNERFDEGAIVAQWPVAVAPGDTAETLASRVQMVERRLYPGVVDHAARGLREGRPVPDLFANSSFPAPGEHDLIPAPAGDPSQTDPREFP